MTDFYDADGNPIYSSPSAKYNARGFESGSVAEKADRTHRRLSQKPITHAEDTPGFWKSLAGSVGLPTSTRPEDIIHSSANLLPGVGGIANFVRQVGGIMNLRKNSGGTQLAADVNSLFNPMAMPMSQVGEGNWGGLAGSMAPVVVGTAAGVATKPTPAQPTAAVRPQARLAQTIPVTVDTPAPGIGTRLGQAAYELLPIPKPIKAVQKLMGKDEFNVSPRTVDVEYTVNPDPMLPTQPNAPPMQFGPLAIEGGPLPNPSGLPSAPVQSPALVDRLLNPPPNIWDGPTLGEAAVGNTPKQQPFLNPTSPAKKMSSDPSRLEGRFEPFDQSSRVTGELPPPPMNPRELAGAESQIGQTARAGALQEQMGEMGGEGGLVPPSSAPLTAPSMSVGFTQQMFDELTNALAFMDRIKSNAMPEGGQPGVLPPNTRLQNHRTSQLATKVAEEQGWNRETLQKGNVKTDKPSKGKKK